MPDQELTQAETAPIGLFTALAPIAGRRPVHLIISGSTDGRLRVLVQPVRMDDGEPPEMGAGFTVEELPAVLDQEMAQTLTTSWVPAHKGLQTVLDEITATTQRAKEETQRKAAGKKGSTAATAATGAAARPPAAITTPAAAAAAAAPAAPAAPPLVAVEPAAAADGVSDLFA